MSYSRSVEISRGKENLTFTGKHALVIGGSGGIGREVALGLAGLGARLTIHGGSSGERLDNVLKAVRARGAEADGFLCPADEPGAAGRILAHCPDPDILVCAWGPFKQGNLQDLDEIFWEKMVFCNLVFPGSVISLIIHGMIERNWGRILLFGGTNTDTIRGFDTSAAYSAAKTALGVVAKSAARMGAGKGVSCNVICPGLTGTEYQDEAAKAYNRKKSPGGRVLESAEIARAALAVLENPNLNGAIVPVDLGVVL
jgi:NAD(P)-dependent dehydrogenase (short-subunit alcohol dehydrogenase family)